MENNISLETYDQSPIFQELQTNQDILVRAAEEMSVTTLDEFSMATGATQEIRKIRTKIAEFFKPLKETAFKLHRDITSREKTIDGPYQNAELIIRGKMEGYVAEQNRIREQEAQRLRKAQEDSILQMAADAEKKGDTGLAESLMEIPITKVDTKIPMPEKTSTRQELVVEITSIKDLAGEVVAGKVGPAVFSVNEKVIKALVTSMGIDAVNKIKGVRCSYKSTLVFRR